MVPIVLPGGVTGLLDQDGGQMLKAFVVMGTIMVHCGFITNSFQYDHNVYVWCWWYRVVLLNMQLVYLQDLLRALDPLVYLQDLLRALDPLALGAANPLDMGSLGPGPLGGPTGVGVHSKLVGRW